MRWIPLPTKLDYYCSEDGRIFRDDHGQPRELKGTLHDSYTSGVGYTGKMYRRVKLQMMRGGEQLFYIHRLVCLTYHGLKPGEIVRHLTTDTLNNHKDALKPGTPLENQTVDRMEQGTYYNRGGIPQPETDLPF